MVFGSCAIRELCLIACFSIMKDVKIVMLMVVFSNYIHDLCLSEKMGLGLFWHESCRVQH